jgi:hypothetical protein
MDLSLSCSKHSAHVSFSLTVKPNINPSRCIPNTTAQRLCVAHRLCDACVRVPNLTVCLLLYSGYTRKNFYLHAEPVIIHTQLRAAHCEKSSVIRRSYLHFGSNYYYYYCCCCYHYYYTITTTTAATTTTTVTVVTNLRSFTRFTAFCR